MRAAIATKYGPPEVLTILDIPAPTPAPDGIVVRIHASSVTAADMMMRRGKPLIGRLFLGVLGPKNRTTGTGFAGVVTAIGPDVTEFALGDRIFGETVFGHGSNADYTCVSQTDVVAKMPDGLDFSEAAVLCDGALTSFNFLQRLIKLEAGQRILINGASGSLGTAAVQLAKHFGAHVTAVCSAQNAALATELGADEVIDYAAEDFTKSAQRWHVIYDTVGKNSFFRSRRVLMPWGVYLSPVLGSTLWAMLLTSIVGRKKARFSATGVLEKPVLNGLLKEVLEVTAAGNLSMVIDRRYSLQEIVAAHHYVETGRKKGNVVLSGAEE
jgi:NADPH:quinone reductase-like Zn-dependent oxidoreductase